MQASKDADWLSALIEEFILDWKRSQGADDYWRPPLVGVASANDPLLAELRRVVDPDHAMPAEILPGAESVIVFFLPFQRWLGEQNDGHGTLASQSWAESYITTNLLIGAINEHLKARLKDRGHLAAVTPATHNFDEAKLVSRWSHKHLAYLAGLGTFGHNHLLITSSGCCGRLGSLVTTMPLAATVRPEAEWCLQKAGYDCLACVPKCKYGALHETRFSRQACYRQCLRNNAHYSHLPLVDVCGKCACEVPCSYQIPDKPAASDA
ncbi:epoxyqueuosine reductase [Desulfoferrobacter suflitae]|uniref:epoxyqueuosine reductase n=1 Tax=Desulfoferrobacter suflitae TaxID=2865782 RepID=UPI0021645746|nr:epoxyqueuosine reductase [Desulfoferrobacter suflitae]MCK8600461.1 epoxyqueuosine reductase [Desulfoferrobacter suflitae]